MLAIFIYSIIAKPEYRLINSIAHVFMPIVNGVGDLITWPVRVGGNLIQKIHKISNLEQENDELRTRLEQALANKNECDIAILVIDAKEGISDRDKKISSIITEAGKGVIICINKWDLVNKETGTLEKYKKEVRAKLAYIDYAPILFISTLTFEREL